MLQLIHPDTFGRLDFNHIKGSDLNKVHKALLRLYRSANQVLNFFELSLNCRRTGETRKPHESLVMNH